MSECLHGETHDHVICILNLWALGKQGIKKHSNIARMIQSVITNHRLSVNPRVFIKYGFLATTIPPAQKFNHTQTPLVLSPL